MKFRSLTRWRLLTITLLFLGYSGYYFCRSDYSVALPLIIAEQVHKGMPASLAQIRPRRLPALWPASPYGNSTAAQSQLACSVREKL